MDISGTPIKIIHHIDTWEHCANLCYQDNKCQFWTWTSSRFPLDSFFGDCDLKEKDQGRKRVTGIISGTSDCGRNSNSFILKIIFKMCTRISTNRIYISNIINNNTQPRNRDYTTRR